jgi:hypothetical protein
MTPEKMEQALQRLVDKDEIVDLVHLKGPITRSSA